MAAKHEDDVKWSDEFYTIKKVVQKGLPTIVKVHEGFYTENEIDSFSAGDMIKLDFQKSYQKVAAVLLNREAKKDREGYILPGEEVMVPLGYKGKLKVIQNVDIFYSVKDLVKGMPRFVKTGRSTNVRQNKTTINLDAGTLLELDRFISGEGLVCKYKDQIVVLNENLKSVFHVVIDENEYTLQNVIDKFELPQIVRFLDSEVERVITEDLHGAIQNITNFSGCLKLMRVVRQDVVIGHYKPASEGSTNSSEKYCRRALALLPLDSEIVNEIEVQIPVYSESDDYEFLCVKNFSKSYDLDIVEGGLYVEFSRTPRIHMFPDIKDETNTDIPPPRPPKPSLKKVDECKANVPPRPKKKFTIPISDLPQSTTAIKSPKVPERPRLMLSNSTTDSQQTEKVIKSPKVPERPGRMLSNFTTDSQQTGKAYSKENKKATRSTSSSSDDDYEPVDKPQYANTKKPHKVSSTQITGPKTVKVIPSSKVDVKRSPINTVNKNESDDDNDEQPVYDDIDDEDIQEEIKKLERGLQIVHTKDTSVIPMTFKVGLKKVQRELLKKLKRLPSFAGVKASTAVLPSKKELQENLEEDSDDNDDMNEYDYPDLSKMDIEPCAKPDVKKNISEIPRYSHNPVKQKPHLDSALYGKSFAKPVGKIVPTMRHMETNYDTEIPLQSMSVEQVYTCFVECGLRALADRCKKEEIDGAFICSLNDTELKETFSLSDLHSKKIEKIKDGWRPRKD